MKFTEALQAVQKADPHAPPYEVVLACGFTPLHLQTFLGAHLQQRLPSRCVKIRPGLYGDPAGTLQTATNSHGLQGAALVLEWFDLDPRLGYRGEGNWGRKAMAGTVEAARLMLSRIAAAIEALPAELPVAVSLPTLRPTPVFHTPGGRLSEVELELQRILLDFCGRIMRRNGCAVVNPALFHESGANRFDLKSDLLTGLPYSMHHADAAAEALADLLAPAPVKKGLISDLDDTLWYGIVGEVGAEHVCWDLASHRQLHGLYQQLLSALAEDGVLVAIASKNDPSVVEKALARPDLRLRTDRLFPIEASWKAKSAAVERILRAWNIGADSVVFVDDSPLELAEVAQAHPGIECIRFPKDDYREGHSFLHRLRNLFGKSHVSVEDEIRLESLRAGAEFQQAGTGGEDAETFLQRVGAELSIVWNHTQDERALELVNKTNQFNLNGVRYTAADWVHRVSGEENWLAVISYLDQFGPLGKIAVIQGHQKDKVTLYIDTWVMSCRAFSRRIEHQCLKVLFEHYSVDQIIFDFKQTPKNGPLQEFLADLTGSRLSGAVQLSRSQFEDRCPPLYHTVEVEANAWTRSNLA